MNEVREPGGMNEVQTLAPPHKESYEAWEKENRQSIELENIDGFLVDPVTGEIHGHAQAVDGFHVTTEDAACWVLQKMMDADAAILALKAKEKAVIENLRSEKNRQIARRKFFEMRFGPELEAFARANLKGKSKTWGCVWGKVSFRTVPAAAAVTDEAAAIAWIYSLGIQDRAIKLTEKLVMAECKDAILADPPPPGNGWEVKAERESVTIKTGV